MAVSERRTQAQRREATRTALLDAAVDCLLEDGYGRLSTRRVAERAGVSQSTQMHHFPTRTTFLVEALRHVSQRVAADLVEQFALRDVPERERYEALLDRAWTVFVGPGFQAFMQLWVAAYTEPELRDEMAGLERETSGLTRGILGEILPDRRDDEEFFTTVDGALALIRGLAMLVPVHGAAAVEPRWRALKPYLLALPRA